MKKFQIEGWPVGNHALVIEVDDNEDTSGALVEAVVKHGEEAIGNPERSHIDDKKCDRFVVWVRQVGNETPTGFIEK